MYKIPKTMYRTEETIKRSKFIATEADVSFKIELPKNSEDSFIRAIKDLTGGETHIIK